MPGCSASSSLRILATCRLGRGTTFSKSISINPQKKENLYLLPHFPCCPFLSVFLSPCNVPLDLPSLWSSCSGWCSSCGIKDADSTFNVYQVSRTNIECHLLFGGPTVKLHIPARGQRRLVAFVAHLPKIFNASISKTGFSRILLWILFRDLTPPAYCWLLWASTGEEINTQHIPAQLSLQSEEDDIQNEVQHEQYCQVRAYGQNIFQSKGADIL